MTFQTVGSVFHNIVLPCKFSEVPPIFKRVLYILKKSKEKKSTSQDASVSYKKACLFLARSANEKRTKHRRCFPFGTFAHVQTS